MSNAIDELKSLVANSLALSLLVQAINDDGNEKGESTAQKAARLIRWLPAITQSGKIISVADVEQFFNEGE